MTQVTGPISDSEWQHLDARGYVDDAEFTGQDQVLIDELRALRALYPSAGVAAPSHAHRAPIRVVKAGPIELHASHAADDASQSPDVLAFREQHLEGRLLNGGEETDWITGHAGQPSSWPIVAPDGTVDGHTRRALPVPTPNEAGYLRTVWTTASGPLEALRRVSERLADRHGWSTVEAVVFVLTGEPPPGTAISARISQRWPGPHEVTLRINPAVPPEQVARMYRRARSGDHAVAPAKAMTDRQAALVRFDEEHAGAGTWDDRRLAWNREHPAWTYRARSSFQRAVTKAKRKRSLLTQPRRRAA